MVKSSLISTTRAAVRESPKEVFNWFLIFCTLAVSFSGVAKGFDEGNIAKHRRDASLHGALRCRRSVGKVVRRHERLDRIDRYRRCSFRLPHLQLAELPLCLLTATHRWGAFVFFASICAVSLVFVWFCMPETAGRSLESMDGLFERPLWKIKEVAYPTKEDVLVRGIRDVEDLDKVARIEEREVVRR